MNLRRFLLMCFSAVVVIIVVSVYVKVEHRGYSNAEQLYTTLRIDIFRDDRVRMAIYSLFDKNMKILSYPFESYLMQIKSIFPLDILSGLKIIPLEGRGYNVYFTSALANADLTLGYNYMTTSFVDEMIANFGVLGFVTVPAFLLWMSDYIDQKIGYDKILWLGAITLMMMYSLNYIIYYLEVVLIVSVSIKYRKKRAMRELRRRQYENGGF